ncbi:MAG: hypothetical protein ISS72_09370 [Candidatus Brocadiae bacterium]|nr:hypothetical protein [Candidatus Brocadiia bacterium]
MTTVVEIMAAISALPFDEFARLRRWIAERDWEAWDKEIEADSEAGKLDFLTEEALEDKRKGRLRDL